MRLLFLSFLLLGSSTVFSQTARKKPVKNQPAIADSAKKATPAMNKSSVWDDDWLGPARRKQKRKNNFGGEDWDVKSPTDSIGKPGSVKKNKQQPTNRGKKKPANNFGGEDWDRKPLQKKDMPAADSMKKKQAN